MKKNLNQKLINLIEYYNLINANFFLSNKPIVRTVVNTTFPIFGTKKEKLDKLKNKIQRIQNCKLKNNAKNLVFSDGNINSKIMIIGEGPGANEDMEGKPFVGRAGKLLDKMLASIKLDRTKVYISNVVNYRPPNDRKPEQAEIYRYSEFLREHISIIEPKILILMGSTAMEALFGSKIKISKERGIWKEVIINNKTYLTIITFHPAYLLRQADQKKYSWEDLKIIRKKIDELGIKF